MNEKNTTIQTLRNEMDKYQTMKNKMEELDNENTRLNSYIRTQNECFGKRK